MKQKPFFRNLLLFILIIGGILGFNYWNCPSCFRDSRDTWFTVLFTILISLALWQGNGWVQNLVDKRVSWLKTPVKRLVWGIISMVICTWMIAWIIGLAFWYFVAGFSPAQFFSRVMPDLSVSVILITAVISVLMFGRSFLLNWRESALELEQVKREKLASQYQSLKDQLNPHFLFNNLNSLTALIKKDPDRAVNFVKELSEVYRYILNYAQKEVVPLDQELDFIGTYLELLNIRFGSNLNANIQSDKADSYVIPPLTLQLLVENAIKHNIVSSSKPLSITIEMELPDYLVIRNNLQKKWDVPSSSGIGLQNIRKRLQFLTDSPLVVLEEEKEFIVKVPLLLLSEQKVTHQPHPSL